MKRGDGIAGRSDGGSSDGDAVERELHFGLAYGGGDKYMNALSKWKVPIIDEQLKSRIRTSGPFLGSCRVVVCSALSDCRENSEGYPTNGFALPPSSPPTEVIRIYVQNFVYVARNNLFGIFHGKLRVGIKDNHILLFGFYSQQQPTVHDVELISLQLDGRIDVTLGIFPFF